MQVCLSFVWRLSPLPVKGCKSRPMLNTPSPMAFSSEGSFKCHLRYGTSVYTGSFEGLAPSSHIGIQTRDARIIRFWHRHSNHCAITTVKYGSEFSWINEHTVIVYVSTYSRFFHLYGDVTIAGEELQNLGLCSALRAFEQGGIFIVPHLLWHGTSVFPVSSI